MTQYEKLRLFIGIELPLFVQEALSKAQRALKKAGADVKWVEVHNIHLTLKFLGYVKNDKVDSIKKAISQTLKNTSSFEISICKEINAFPSIKNMRVLWIGIEKGNDIIQKIQAQIEDDLEKIGIEKEERKFTPHLTLGRLKSAKSKESLIRHMEKTYLDKNYDLPISKITLFQSILTPQGPIYNILSEVGLN